MKILTYIGLGAIVFIFFGYRNSNFITAHSLKNLTYVPSKGFVIAPDNYTPSNPIHRTGGVNPHKRFLDLKFKRSNEKERDQIQYIRNFSYLAMGESAKYGMPASINMAQGILESNSGRSPLTRHGKNHFGVKCFAKSCKKDKKARRKVTSHCMQFHDDHVDDRFIRYKSNWASWRAHSKLLQRKRYRSLRNLGSSNYTAWAHGLKKAGYATDPRYAEKVIALIEKYELWRLDR